MLDYVLYFLVYIYFCFEFATNQEDSSKASEQAFIINVKILCVFIVIMLIMNIIKMLNINDVARGLPFSIEVLRFYSLPNIIIIITTIASAIPITNGVYNALKEKKNIDERLLCHITIAISGFLYCVIAAVFFLLKDKFKAIVMGSR